MIKDPTPQNVIEALNEITVMSSYAFATLQVQIQELESELKHARQELDNERSLSRFKISSFEARNKELEIELSKRHCSECRWFGSNICARNNGMHVLPSEFCSRWESR